MAEEGDLRVNGKVYDPNTLTFREQREIKRIVRDELFDGEMPDEDDLGIADTMPALALVMVRRDNPDYTLDDALDLVLQDVIVTAEDAEAEKKAAPPTKARKRAPRSTTSTSEASGSPS
jgi:hypothetical protein